MLLTSGASIAFCVAGAISAGAIASGAALGCASRKLMTPEPASLSLSGGSVTSAKSPAPVSSAPVAAEADAAARPESEVQRDRGILGGDAGP